MLCFPISFDIHPLDNSEKLRRNLFEYINKHPNLCDIYLFGALFFATVYLGGFQDLARESHDWIDPVFATVLLKGKVGLETSKGPHQVTYRQRSHMMSAVTQSDIAGNGLKRIDPYYPQNLQPLKAAYVFSNSPP